MMKYEYVTKKGTSTASYNSSFMIAKYELGTPPEIKMDYDIYLNDLRSIIRNVHVSSALNSDISIDMGNSAIPNCDLTLLENKITRAIERLCKSGCNSRDLQYFQAEFEDSLRTFADAYELSAGQEAATLMSLLRQLMGVILGAIISPALPFSSSARNYIGSFFKSPLANDLDNRFKPLRDEITNEAILKGEATKAYHAELSAKMGTGSEVIHESLPEYRHSI